MKPFQIVTLSLVLCMVFSACGKLPSTSSPDSESPPITPASEKSPPDSAPLPAEVTSESHVIDTPDPVPNELIEKAKADLMGRLGISKEEIQVVDAKAVRWPDTSLGCPQAGMAYAEVITPGYWILLRVAENQYPYHTDMEAHIVLCQEESLPSFPVTPGEIDDGQPWMPAD